MRASAPASQRITGSFQTSGSCLARPGRDDLKVPADDSNVTKRIDTLLVNPLHQLLLGSFGGSNATIRTTGRELNLAFRNLTRAWHGPALQRPAAGRTLRPLAAGCWPDPDRERRASLDALADDQKKSFAQDTPLWFYVLLEAELNGGRLTGVGGRIVAEVFHRAYETEHMIKMAAPSTKKIPRNTRATTPAAMSIATTAIVITSICLYSAPPFVLESTPLSSSHQGPLASSGGVKVRRSLAGRRSPSAGSSRTTGRVSRRHPRASSSRA